MDAYTKKKRKKNKRTEANELTVSWELKLQCFRTLGMLGVRSATAGK